MTSPAIAYPFGSIANVDRFGLRQKSVVSAVSTKARLRSQFASV